ncbi:hypothetical protein N9K84_05140 [Candidatus Poseidoniales archaeon]|nr:hypothetical protein [Candidatus Poseidoniales archaeon]
MTDPVISPDGKWMWTGSEWIDAPPSKEISIHDSVVQGDFNITTQVNHHRHGTIKTPAAPYVCPNCGVEDSIEKKCYGIFAIFRWKKDNRCGLKGCDYCFKLDPNGPQKEAYYCAECHKQNFGNVLMAMLWMILLTISLGSAFLFFLFKDYL